MLTATENPRIQELLKLCPKANASKTVLSRCPGRISFSKHSDYVNNSLIYLADDRDIYCLSKLITDPNDAFFGKLSLFNSHEDFADSSFDIKKLSEEQSKDWDFYIRELIKIVYSKYQEEISKKHPNYLNYGIVFSYDSTLPPAGGLSSSHALIISTLINLIDLLGLVTISHAEIFEICQQVEHARGFQSGLGDQVAELLAKKNKLLFARLYPQLEYSYVDIPEDFSVITIPSFVKADKSLDEFADANIKITAYKFANLIFGNPDKKRFLGDLVYKLSEKEIISKLKELPKYMSVEEIIEEATKNRVDKNSKPISAVNAKSQVKESIESILSQAKIKKLPEKWPIQGVALYGLAEGARANHLKANFSLDELGKHLNKSHKAENNFAPKDNSWQAIDQAEKDNYMLDEKAELREHIGVYSASTIANDELQSLAEQLDNVYGSSITGAGLGGNNIALCKKGSEAELIDHLIKNYYEPKKLSKKALDEYQGLHIVKSSNGAEILFSEHLQA